MPIPKDDYGKLTGTQKAAMLMLALEDRHSRMLFERMEDEEIRELSRTMSGLGTVRSGTVEQLFIDFAAQLSSTGTLVGSYGTTERLLRRTLSDKRVGNIMEEIRGPAGRTMWDKLGNVNEAVLATYLKNEYPQTVAVVMAKLKPDHAARVLAMLPENFALEVINRMLRMQTVQKDVLDHVERTLRAEFMTNLARTTRHDSHEQMAEIFNSLDRTAENRFMTALEERNREAADRIKRLMFTFDDLARLDSNGVQALLHQVDKEQLALALKGASDDVKNLFFSNMAERAAKMMQEDMDALGAVRVKDVDEAQAAIVVAAKALADAGEIIIAGGNDDQLIA